MSKLWRDMIAAESSLRVWIEPQALVAILAEAQSSADGCETGGILAGFKTELGFLVTHAGSPGAEALREPHLFSRDLDHSERLLERAFTATGAVWIGDWHTHTVACDCPSAIDAGSYDVLLADHELAFDAFVAIIVTSQSGKFCDCRLAVWLACPSGLVRRVLEI
jgi:integrative and conjugative element protein (TIGR02256 family)